MPISTTGSEHPSSLGRLPSSNTISPLISEMPDAQSATVGKRLGRNGVGDERGPDLDRGRTLRNPSKFMPSRISGLTSSPLDFDP